MIFNRSFYHGMSTTSLAPHKKIIKEFMRYKTGLVKLFYQTINHNWQLFNTDQVISLYYTRKAGAISLLRNRFSSKVPLRREAQFKEQNSLCGMIPQDQYSQISKCWSQITCLGAALLFPERLLICAPFFVWLEVHSILIFKDFRRELMLTSEVL